MTASVHRKVRHRGRDTYAAFGRGDIPAVLGMQVCRVLRFRAGKLASFQPYVDTGQLQAVMGAR